MAETEKRSAPSHIRGQAIDLAVELRDYDDHENKPRRPDDDVRGLRL